jgi:hypothetical protein
MSAMFDELGRKWLTGVPHALLAECALAAENEHSDAPVQLSCTDVAVDPVGNRHPVCCF